MQAIECGDYVHLTASGLVKTGPGRFIGIFVAAASSTPTIKVWDSASAAGKVLLGTFTPSGPKFYPAVMRFTSGLYIEISGTVDCTVNYI